MEQEIHENDKEAQNKTMFAISDVKAHFDLGNTKTIHHLHTTKGTFDLENRNVYDSVTNKILKVGLQNVYNTEFISRLGRLAILQVQPFLNHHYKASENKEQFIEYLEYAVLYHVYIKDEGLKARIKDWISKQKQTPSQDEKKNTFNFTNNFDTIDSKIVYDHFYKNLVEPKMISEDDLKDYLKHAFDLQEPNRNMIVLKNVRTKQDVIRVFYNYFKVIAGKPHAKQNDYAKLLGEYFQGYKTNNVMTNFSK